MTLAFPARGRILLLLALLITAVMVGSNPIPAPAAPAAPTTTDPEGGSASLQTALANSSRGYSEAKNRLAVSRKRQAALVKQQADAEKRIGLLSKDVDALAATAYREGRIDTLSAALDSGSIPAFLQKSALIDRMAGQNNQKIAALTKARKDLDRQKTKVDGEIKIQATQEKAMAKRKSDAERALATVSGGATGSGFSGNTPRASRSAPRNSDGSWPSQSCSVDDPTTSGCLTARTASALQQARADGFTRFTKCFRSASFGEHPKGRACDMSASASGFGGVASGGDKAYGNRLAAYFVNNADQLAVLYVIWFRQIWMPSTGWRPYSGGVGPSAEHTNHVHLSVQ